jgi:nucleotide-binding universal stress UspA family protein
VRKGHPPASPTAVSNPLEITMTEIATAPDVAHPPCIVVGIDSSDNASRAAAWAAREAADRGLALVLLHAVDLPGGAGASAEPPGWADGRRERGRKLLERVQATVREQFPELPITTEVSDFSAAKSLVIMSGHAQLVVTGTRGHGGFAGLLLGSVSVKVCAHAQCPAVVVRGEEPGEPLDEIVLGVERGEPEAPIRFAFATADRLGAKVRAVRAWPPDPMYGGYYYAADTETAERQIADDVEAVLKPVHDDFPGVEVSTYVARGNAVPTLIEAARGSRLLVVGAHRRRTPLSVGLGSVVHGLLSHSPTPVAVVPIV